jgi:Arc/MetJ family transcription regulator
MADSTSEAVLKALLAALKAKLPRGARLERNAALPVSAPKAGLIILRDGDPGEPLVVMGGAQPTYEYEHAADVDIIAESDAVFDALKRAVGAAVAADRTLGGLTFDLRGRAPVKALVRDVEGRAAFTAATVPVVLHYTTTDPLS